MFLHLHKADGCRGLWCFVLLFLKRGWGILPECSQRRRAQNKRGENREESQLFRMKRKEGVDKRSSLSMLCLQGKTELC